MINTSDQTTKQNDTTRLIVGEVGIDTETGIVGKGHSYDNGKTFTVDDTIYGRIYHADDHDKIWKGIQDQVAKVVAPAKSAADSAQSTADAAVASAQVTSDAVTAIASATAEAKQGANDAMSRAKSAWDVATNATNAAISAQSDAKQAASSVTALLTSVDTLQGNVTDLQAKSTTQANEIENKVTRSDVTGMLTDYATQEYTQSLVTQTADEWNLNLTNLKNDTQTSVTNLSAAVDGIKSTVATKADQSTVTQLSNLIQSKVSTSDYTSTINQLSNDINLRVKSADLISQINLQAGAASIQSDKIVLDGNTTVITGEAFIPSAAISSISADKIMLGSSALYNSDGTLNLVNQSNGLKALIQVKQGLVQNTTQSIISFSSDYNNRAFSITPVGATVTPTLFFERYDQTAGHWLGFTRNEVQREGLTFNTWDNEGERFFVACHARFHKNITAEGIIMQGSWNGTTGKPMAGILSIESGNTIWSGSDFLAIGDHLSNSFTNVMARSFSSQSTLSSKTNIETVDPKDALDLVNRTDIRSYQYKADVAQGKTKRYTSMIIDDVNDVSQYYAPDEFVNEERTGRDDGSAVGYLFLAVQELTRRIKTLEEKLNG
ncbi:gp58-like family protein [Limosilactobacillus fermentum]|uniref:gp58-like family protein n=1 Tax=Limosilactobacillus fermentum TaxID=1613 RepID=UPI003D780916